MQADVTFILNFNGPVKLH